ncbi:VWA domain-containing protein [Salinibacillus xinjiangensis]|uniref:VWA domain-containing protein n=1 Tax=Salinibacillus xinjiangensis TaxID=1229268 RepID=A0A6G1X931_9BACI|nr:VWA domain-containing protein [Salinibacillus xinjiangensis]
MLFKIKTLIVFLVMILAIIGCTNDEKEEPLEPIAKEAEDQNNDENQPEENSKEEQSPSAAEEEPNIEVDPLPTTFKELEKLKVGVDAGPLYESGKDTQEQNKEIAEHFKDLPLPEDKANPSELELDYLFREMLKRVQLDFQGPEQIMKEIKFQSLGNPDIEDARYQFKENLNVVILLDASGSMAQVIDGKTKMAAAKDAISNFLGELPEETNVALRVYGHKGTGSDSDKELSCSSSELVYGFDSYESSSFDRALSQVKPAGWTPTGLALSDAQKDLSSYDGKKNTNIVYLVSDGIETCDTNPVESAKELYDSEITPIINVLGFDVDGEGQNHLQEIADSVDGIYQTVSDENELAKELDKVNDIAQAWEEWKDKGMESLDYQKTTNSLKIFSYVTDQSVKETDERNSMNFIVRALEEHGYISSEAKRYLLEKNKEYHAWIQSEVNQLEEELDALNESSYKEAVKALEEKYELNVE